MTSKFKNMSFLLALLIALFISIIVAMSRVSANIYKVSNACTRLFLPLVLVPEIVPTPIMEKREVEPNDRFSQADANEELISDVTYIGDGVPAVGDVDKKDIDLFRFQLSNAGTIRIDIDNPSSQNLDIALYKEANTDPLEVWKWSELPVTWAGETGVIYYVQVQALTWESGSANYRLKLEFPSSSTSAQVQKSPNVSTVFHIDSMQHDQEFFDQNTTSFSNWAVEGNTAAFNWHIEPTKISIEHLFPTCAKPNFIKAIPTEALDPFSMAEIDIDLSRSVTAWDSMGINTQWNIDGGDTSSAEDINFIFAYSMGQIFVDIRQNNISIGGYENFDHPAEDTFTTAKHTLRVENDFGIARFYFDGVQVYEWPFPGDEPTKTHGYDIQLQSWVDGNEVSTSNGVTGSWENLELQPVEVPWIIDDFESNQLDPTIWKIAECDDTGSWEVTEGALKFQVTQNSSADWKGCSIRPIAYNRTPYRIQARVTMIDGNRSPSNSNSWIGIGVSCGSNWVNYMISPEIASFSDAISGRVVVEDLSSENLPIERILVAEWTGSQIQFSSFKVDETINLGETIAFDCDQHPDFWTLAAGTNLGGAVTGTIDNVEVLAID